MWGDVVLLAVSFLWVIVCEVQKQRVELKPAQTGLLRTNTSTVPMASLTIGPKFRMPPSPTECLVPTQRPSVIVFTTASETTIGAPASCCGSSFPPEHNMTTAGFSQSSEKKKVGAQCLEVQTTS